MKIIDKTPFYDENGKLSAVNRLKAFMQFGRSWEREMEAQKEIIAVMEKVLDKGFTLLRNVTPPGLEIPIPFILVGPTGIYIIYVTPLIGMFRAKGDQWGTISGNSFKPEKPNLLTRTEAMARAIQLYLQRQGFSEMLTLEAVLLCSSPSIHIDSLRPIVRIVLRDAVDRFAFTVREGRPLLGPEAVNQAINLLLNPPTPKEETPAVAAETPEDPEEPLYALPKGDDFVPAFSTAADLPADGETPAFLSGQEPAQPVIEAATPPRRKGFSPKQWLLLAGMLIIWCLVMAVFLYLVIKDLFL